MRPSQLIYQWLKSGQLHRERDSQANSVRRLREYPSFIDLLDAARLLNASGQSEEIPRAIDNFLSGDMTWFADYMIDWLKSCADNPATLPPFQQNLESNDTPFSAISLMNTSELTISIQGISPSELDQSKASRPGRIVQFSGQQLYFKVLKGSSIKTIWWRCRPFTDSTDLKTLECWKEQERTLTAGEKFYVRGDRESISFVSSEDSAALMQVVDRTRDVGSAVDFDVDTGAYKASHPVDRLATRKMVAVSALRMMGSSDRTVVINKLLNEGPFYQRWHMIREALAGGMPDAVSLLVKAAADPNPSIQRASALTIQILRNRGMINDD